MSALTTDIDGSIGWPPKPDEWPEVMTDLELCMFLGLDHGRSPATAKRSLRHLRRTSNLADIGRIGGKVRFRKGAIEAWMIEREKVGQTDMKSVGVE